MRRILINLWPVAAIFVALAIFFYPVWLQGKIPLPADFVVGTYYPWLDYKWPGYEFGVPVKNPITTDVVSFIFPMQMYAMDLIKQGVVPLWNPLILTGTPLLANLQSAPFSPTNFLYFLLPKLDSWSLQIILQPFLAALFLFFLLREFGISKISSVAGGIFYAFSGFLMIWLEWNGHSLTAAFFPLIFLLVIKWLKEGKWLWGVLLSVTLALQIFSGYPQIILYEMLALILVIVFNFNLKRTICLGIFILLGLGLSAIQILPALELLKYSQRGVEDVINVSAFLPWQYLITFFAPDFFGNHSTGNFWGEGDYTLVTGYSGVVVIILAGIALLLKFKDKNVKFAGSLILLSLLAALYNPISVSLKDGGLFALQAASAHRALVLSNLGFAILAAYGLDSLLGGKAKIYQVIRACYLPAVFIFGFGLAALYGLQVSSENITLAGNFRVALRNLILPISLISITFIMVIIFILTNKSKKVLAILLTFLAIAELFRFGWKFTPFSSKNLVFPETPVISFLQNQQKPFRIAAEDVIPINLMMVYGIETAEGYDAVYPLTYAKYLAVLNSGNVDNSPMGRYGSITKVDSNLLNLVNTKYVLALKRDKNGKPDKDGKLPEKYSQPFLKEVFEDKSVVILENTNVLSRSFMVYDWDVSKNEEILNKLIANYPISGKIIIEENVNINKERGKGAVKYNESAGRKNIIVNLSKPGLLFISDGWFPGWIASVDGKQENILKADYSFMAVPIREAGQHEINLEYKPVSFEKGKILTLASAALLLVISGLALPWRFNDKSIA